MEEDKKDCVITNGIFTLLHEKNVCVNKEIIIDEEISSFLYLDDNIFSHFQKNILYYIAGNAANQFLQQFPCVFCEDIILNKNIFYKDHNYLFMSITDNICFTNFKSHGKLKFVSKFVFDIILYTEKC